MALPTQQAATVPGDAEVRVPNGLAALGLTLLGAYLHRDSFEITADLRDEVPLLLHVFSTCQMPPTIATLCAAKLIAFLAFWGFLAAIRPYCGLAAALVGGLLVAADPIASLNNGRLLVFAAVAAVFWWLLAQGAIRHRAAWSAVASAVALLAAFLLSPWYLVFVGVAAMPVEPIRSVRPPARWLSRAIVLLVAIVCAAALGSGALEKWRSAVLLSEAPSGLQDFLSLSLSLGMCFRRGALLLVPLTLVVLSVLRPAAAAVVVLSALLAGFLGPLDLIGVMCLTATTAAGCAFALHDGLDGVRAPAPVWLRNAALIAAIGAITYFHHYWGIRDLLRTHRFYRREFHSLCAKDRQRVFRKGGLLILEPETANERGCWAVFGNRHACLPARYRASFEMAWTDPAGSFVQVIETTGIGGLERTYPRTDPDGPGKATLRDLDIAYSTLHKPDMRIEHQVWYGGQGVLAFNGVRIAPVGRR